MRKVHLITYGCQMNVRDSEGILGLLEQHGYAPIDEPAEADVILLNTCSVREKPERKVLARLHEFAQLKRERPGLVIGVCGCMAQAWGAELLRKNPAVDIVCGPANLARLPQLIAQAAAAERQILALDIDPHAPPEPLPQRPEQRFRAFVTIVHGCTNFCSYCIVPFVRGPERSRPPEEIVAEVEQLAAQGCREVTLLGQNVNAYGRDRPDACTFAELLAKVAAVEGIARVRFTTSHPKDFTEDIIEAVAELPEVCEHIHLPIQAGHDEVLRRMNRRYTVAQYLDLVERIRQRIPGVALSTDVMVGFPGETEEQFEATLDVFRAVRFDQAFMFIYNPRPKTKAAQMNGQLPRAVKTKRLQRLAELQNEIAREINEAQVGEVFEVLVEGPSQTNPKRWAGRTRTNKLAVFDPPPAARPGQFLRVRAKNAFLWGWEAEVVGEEYN